MVYGRPLCSSRRSTFAQRKPITLCVHERRSTYCKVLQAKRYVKTRRARREMINPELFHALLVFVPRGLFWGQVAQKTVLFDESKVLLFLDVGFYVMKRVELIFYLCCFKIKR